MENTLLSRVLTPHDNEKSTKQQNTKVSNQNKAQSKRNVENREKNGDKSTKAKTEFITEVGSGVRRNIISEVINKNLKMREMVKNKKISSCWVCVRIIDETASISILGDSAILITQKIFLKREMIFLKRHTKAMRTEFNQGIFKLSHGVSELRFKKMIRTKDISYIHSLIYN